MVDGTAERRLAEVFARLARSLLAEPSLAGTLGRLCEVAVDVVSGCEAAGTSIVRGGNVETIASTGPLPLRLDQLQYETGEGPCLDVIRHHRVFETEDLSSEVRWPEFSSRATAETEVRSVLSVRLYAEEGTYGALNLYSTRIGAYDEDSRAVASILAAHGSVAFARLQEREHTETLQRAIDSRDVIGQAKGVLMQRRGITAEQAFNLLVRASQRLNRKLRDVAEDVALTGADPEALG
jgi:transcriptional regulator with GAF, ATPase, and Fis domain